MDHSNQKFPSQKLNQVRIAGIYLFGPHVANAPDFINKLSLESIKNAFREKPGVFTPICRPTSHRSK